MKKLQKSDIMFILTLLILSTFFISRYYQFMKTANDITYKNLIIQNIELKEDCNHIFTCIDYYEISFQNNDHLININKIDFDYIFNKKSKYTIEVTQSDQYNCLKSIKTDYHTILERDYSFNECTKVSIKDYKNQ